MTKSKTKRNRVNVSGSLAKAVQAELTQLINNNDEIEKCFPSSLTSTERAFIHELARRMGLKSKSRGKPPNRILTVFKREKSSIIQNDAFLCLNDAVRNDLSNLFPADYLTLTAAEQAELRPATDPPRHDTKRVTTASVTSQPRWADFSRGLLAPRVAPSPIGALPQRRHRDRLPIAAYRETILKAIEGSQIVIIEAATGSGKTTQVPQYILEEYAENGSRSCRIVVTQPRRIAAVSSAERVAWERNEKAGQSVGYSIRNDTKFTPGVTVLTYCTTGVLLRCLMTSGSPEVALASATHLIIDEVHERDLHVDMLLVVLKEIRLRLTQLKIILMSATADTKLIRDYFGASVVSIERENGGFGVNILYLHDILRETKFRNSKMEEYLAKIGTQPVVPGLLEMISLSTTSPQDSLDSLMWSAWQAAQHENQTDEDDLNILLDKLLLATEGVAVDYREPRLGLTTLMIAAARLRVDVVDALLRAGADPRAMTPSGHTARDIAEYMGGGELCDILIRAEQQAAFKNESDPDFPLPEEISAEDRQRECAYLASIREDLIDYDLLFSLLCYIQFKCKPGAILVFLPGMDEILKLRDRISQDSSLSSKLHIVLLHSQLPVRQQFNLIEPTPLNMRKCILATNIAETSVTIEEVNYVVDTGKVKERSYDSELGIGSLESQWVSRASATQRKGRTGRVCDGHCFRLYSVKRYLSFQLHPTPEVLRSPLQGICLQVKCLAPATTAIADFVAKMVEPPPQQSTRNAVQYLKAIDALYPWEDLTELGQHLVQIHSDPRIAKMVVWGCVLKCLDPVLTVASCLAYDRGVFLVPTTSEERQRLAAVKEKFAENVGSDHFVFLRAFQGYLAAERNSSRVKEFCAENMISRGAMEAIREDRDRILQQLRSCDLIKAKPPFDVHDANRNSFCWPLVKAALLAANYPDLARIDCIKKKKPLVRLRNQPRVELLYSVLKLPSATDWLIYQQASRRANYVGIEGVSAVSPLTVALFAGASRLPPDYLPDLQGIRAELFPGEVDSDSDDEQFEKEEKEEEEKKIEGGKLLKIDDWISIMLHPVDAAFVLALRQKIHLAFLRRLSATHSRGNFSGTDPFSSSLASLLQAEETALFGPQALPADVGLSPAVAATRMASVASRLGRTRTGSPRFVVVRLGAGQGRSLPDCAAAAGPYSFPVATHQKMCGWVRGEGREVVAVFYAPHTHTILAMGRIRGPQQVRAWPVHWFRRPQPLPLRDIESPIVRTALLNSADGQELEEAVGRALLNAWRI